MVPNLTVLLTTSKSLSCRVIKPMKLISTKKSVLRVESNKLPSGRVVVPASISPEDLSKSFMVANSMGLRDRASITFPVISISWEKAWAVPKTNNRIKGSVYFIGMPCWILPQIGQLLRFKKIKSTHDLIIPSNNRIIHDSRSSIKPGRLSTPCPRIISKVLYSSMDIKDRRLRTQQKEGVFQIILHLMVFHFLVMDHEKGQLVYELEWYQGFFFFNYIWANLLISYVLLPRFFYQKKYAPFIVYTLLVITAVIVIEEFVLEVIFFPDTRGADFNGV